LGQLANDQQKTKTEKGDTSNEVKKGTFLKSFDSLGQLALTAMGGTVTLSSKRFFCVQAAAIESVREAWQTRDWCATQ
jgi:hypothetical protein